MINMDETKNWKTVTVDEDGEPILKYDAHHDETVNIRTGQLFSSFVMVGPYLNAKINV